MIVISRKIPMFGVYFEAMVSKTQSNQNQVSQRRDRRVHFSKSWGSYNLMSLSFNFPRSVNPRLVGGFSYSTDISLLSSKIIKGCLNCQEQLWPENLRIFAGHLLF